MKKVTLTITQTLDEKSFNSQEYQEFIRGIESKEFEKEMMEQKSGDGCKFKSFNADLKIEDING